MAQEGPTKARVSVNGIPEGFGLLRTKKLLQENLENNNAVTEVKFLKNKDNSTKLSVIIVGLREEKYAEILLAKVIIEVEFEDTLHRLMITKSRPAVTNEKPETSSNHEAVASPREEIAETSTPKTVAKRNSPTSELRTATPAMYVTNQQCSLHCTYIPRPMYNEDALYYHFGRFGNIVRLFISGNPRRQYAMITYDCHRSAMAALQFGWDLGPRFPGRLKIEWNKHEAEQLRRPASHGSPLRKATYVPNLQSGGNQERKLQVVMSKPVTWQELSQRDKEIFCGDESRCVLVQNVSKHITDCRLRLYFENNQRSGGGPVTKMVLLMDGILIVFQDEDTANHVVEHESHMIDNVPLRMFSKPIPNFYDDRFIIEGKFKDASHLQALLECCDENSTSFKLTKLHDVAYIVIYDKAVDVKMIMKAAGKIPLDDIRPKVMELCKTDCVAVDGLKSDVNNDMIKLTFMNKKVSGGDVTFVERKPGTATALVYFANFADTEKVIERSNKQKITVGTSKVNVSLCFDKRVETRSTQRKSTAKNTSGKGNERNKPNQGLRQYEYLPEIDNDILEYVRRSPNLFEELSLVLDKLAKINFVRKPPKTRGPPQVTVRCIPLTRDKIKKEFLNEQQKFQDECCLLITNYLAKFTSLTSQFKEEKLYPIKKAHLWKEDSDCIKVEIDENDVVSVFIRWNYTNRGCTKVIGLNDDVTAVMKWLTQRCDLSDKCVTYTEQNLQILVQCEIIKDVTEKFQSRNVEITVDVKNLNLTFKGPTQEVTSAQNVITNKLQGIKSCKLSFLDGMQVTFLTDALAPGRTYNDKLVKNIKHNFEAYQVKAYLGQQIGKPMLFYTQHQDIDRATEILNSLVQIKQINGGKGINELLQSEEWKRLEQRLNSSGNARLCVNKRNSTIFIIGLAEAVQTNQKQVMALISTNTIESRVVNIPYAVALFISQYHKDVHTENGLKEVEWHMTSENSGGIFIKGKLLELAKAEGWITDEASLIQTTSHSVSEPGMKKYLHGRTGKQFLKTTETISKCVILIDTDQCPNLKPISRKPTKANSSTPIMTVNIPTPNHGSTCTLSVVQNDITEHHCDAIVNASNEQLELRSAGVSKSILSKGGAMIQQEMDQEKLLAGGDIKPGQAVTTRGGNLRCNNIIHVVGPDWSQEDAVLAMRCLKKCVHACLQEAESCGATSIAIPAISCGVFGGKPNTCARLIVTTIVKYFNQNTSSIKQVYLIEMNNMEVLDEFKKALSNIGSGNTIKPPVTRTLVHGPALNVKFHVGNISDNNADVIVTATPPQNLASGCGSAVSKALLRKAGPNFQAACQMASAKSPATSGTVVETPGYNLACNKVYHVLLNDYKANLGGSEFIKAINKCLTMADSDGFTRIAFPAIGTGGLKYPAQHVAQWFKSEIMNFKGTNLRHVDFVLFPTDQATNATFRNAFQSSHVAVSVKTGNILGSDCDVIVNTTSNFNLSGGQLCQKLLALTGNTVVNECINSPLHSSTAYRVTSGGNLPCKNIVHIITPSSSQALVNVLNDVLDLVEQQMMLTSIAIPAIGTGQGGLRSGDVAVALQTAIQRFSNTNPTYLLRIDVVVFEASMIPDFQSSLSSMTSSPKNNQTTPKPSTRASLNIPFENQSSDRVETTLYFCAKDQTSIDEAWKRIREHVKDKTLTKSVESEAIGSLCSAEVDELMALQRKHDVILRKARFGTGKIKLVVSGLKDDVVDAFTSASGIIQDYKEALTCAEYVTWKYKDKHTQQMKDFPLRSSCQIESAYKKNNKGQITVPIKVCGRNYNFIVDFSTMQETCLETSDVVKVIRSSKSSSDDFPSTWDDTGNVPWKKVKLASSSSEYRDVMQKFGATGSLRNVCKLERIQNPTLYKQFQAQKRKVEERMKRDGCNFQVARQLFHGTSADVCDKIYKDGFDRSHAGRHATAFGRGVYFATTSQYSQGYAKPDANGEMRMFLADVITGEFCQGSPSVITPPVKPGHTSELYDSVVNNVSNPTMFVVFKDASVYPAYILKFK